MQQSSTPKTVYREFTRQLAWSVRTVFDARCLFMPFVRHKAPLTSFLLVWSARMSCIFLRRKAPPPPHLFYSWFGCRSIVFPSAKTLDLTSRYNWLCDPLHA
eukprot:1160543-Pelagomonas_calceolata.AAC.8